MDLSSSEHYKALGHPTRQRLLFELDQPATISQLAATLGTHKGNIAHHLKVLRAAGLVSITSTRHVRGGTEQYYQRVAQIMRVSGARGHRDASRDVRRHRRGARRRRAGPVPRVAPPQADRRARSKRITATLNDLLHGTEQAAEGQRRYGMLLGLYEQLDADAPPLDTRA